ncbi:MAG TPA: hypothetical protein PL124_00075 [Candidatus Cloacimonadota bacterium]|nr:hypothetical protein [Candidatus Cloacimonadota bacterium]HPS37787.1 hypothetical protein [Candidatus Cloacimonadota bacterium]
MKVKLNYNQRAYSGKLNDLVYYWDSQSGMMIARRKPVHKEITAQNRSFGINSVKLSGLIQNPEFRIDMKLYLGLLREADMNDGINRWYALYNRMIWGFVKKHQEWNINELDHDTIISNGLSCGSVKTAVDDGLLPRVEGYQRMTNLI